MKPKKAQKKLDDARDALLIDLAHTVEGLAEKSDFNMSASSIRRYIRELNCAKQVAKAVKGD